MKTNTLKRKLARETREACKFRGHTMGNFTYSEYHARITGIAKCLDCGKRVHINTHPMPNDIDISGEAVALSCN